MRVERGSDVMAMSGRMAERAATWFVTRKFLPRVGGMERLSWELTSRIAKRRSTRVVALRGGSRWLPLFLGYSAVLILANAIRGRILLLHLGDPALAPLGRLAKLCDVPVCVTVHGLDVMYSHPLYRLWLRTFFGDFDAYICISSAARAAAISRGVPASRACVIGVGVAAPAAAASADRETDLLLFVGRLVRRKGLEWFVRIVLPRVAQRRDGVRLAIIGAGPERSAIQKSAVAAGVAGRITWLGAVPESERMTWLCRAAVCIAPNVHVPDDIEGDGIVALEAAAAGCALIAADLEGLRDAIVDGQGGRLIASEDADAWTAAIAELLDDPSRAAALGERARAWARAERDWEGVCDRYETLFDAIERGAHS
ncbi:MAG: glycosyltransferase family 4 protein [Betaproteobacteria bacterium]